MDSHKLAEKQNWIDLKEECFTRSNTVLLSCCTSDLRSDKSSRAWQTSLASSLDAQEQTSFDLGWLLSMHATFLIDPYFA